MFQAFTDAVSSGTTAVASASRFQTYGLTPTLDTHVLSQGLKS
jgi:hypothetical protein